MNEEKLKNILIELNSGSYNNLCSIVQLHTAQHSKYEAIPLDVIESINNALRLIDELNEVAFNKPICYKTGTACKHYCQGLCKESC